MIAIIELLEDPLFLLFLIIVIGTFIGQWSIKGVGLGSSAVLFVAMVFGHFGYEISPVIQSFGLSLFIVTVGLQAGPRFFRMIRTSGVVFAIISVLVIAIAGITTFITATIMDIPPALGIGIMTGALTSTPGLAAALEATGDPTASVGYGIAYPFGVLAVVLFVQLYPKIMKVDLTQELKVKASPIKRSLTPTVMTIEVTKDSLHKRTLKELHLNKGASIVLSRVIRGNRTIVGLSDTVILKGDYLVAVGTKEDLKLLCEKIGKEIPTKLSNHDNITFRRITVESEDFAGKSLRELDLRNEYGTTVTRIERSGFEFNQSPNWRLDQGDILTVVGCETRLNETERFFSRRKLKVTNIHLFSFSLILLMGIVIGVMPIYIPSLGTINLGTAGGPLFAALIIGHFGKIGPIRARFFKPSNQVLGDIGLALFLAGAGTTAGAGVVEVIQQEGVNVLLAGAIITTVPLLGGFILGTKVFKLNIVHCFGALCGGMTSTPGLGALNGLVKSEDPAIVYAAAYPFALIFVAIMSQVLFLFL
ncbi:TrkA C-terminal domain-containing protein [Proteinivorax hydrogeniformans]|uniref:TrkA C-terminal domain-containing protein n=1 Tax=Proteinivorax hydrogeniformans TaxID=1826727 RepID=A0AAU8HVG1_9FIRM